MPHDVYIDPRPLFSVLLDRGIQPILSHPERLSYVQKRPERVQSWIELGCILQVTAGALVGEFGQTAERTAWELLTKGLVALVATDAHDTASRPPRMSAAIEAIERRACHAVARRICIENPARLLEGRELALPRMAMSGGRS